VPSTLKFVALSLSLLPAGLAYGQSEASTSSTAPVAYVYVARPTHIDGFAASSSGKLTPVPGSPFANTEVTDFSVTKESFCSGWTANGGGNKADQLRDQLKGIADKSLFDQSANCSPRIVRLQWTIRICRSIPQRPTIYVQQALTAKGRRRTLSFVSH